MKKFLCLLSLFISCASMSTYAVQKNHKKAFCGIALRTIGCSGKCFNKSSELLIRSIGDNLVDVMTKIQDTEAIKSICDYWDNFHMDFFCNV